jgi:Ca-activated chloride channel homolog
MFDPITQFAHPEWFWLLLLLPLLAAWRIGRRQRDISAYRHPTLAPLDALPRGWRVRLRAVPMALRLLGLAALIVALARPQTSARGERVFREGIDITVVLDISGSMLAEDFSPNRLGAAKKVAEEFIRGRETDRIGLVIFAGESFTQSPLTTDYDVLVTVLRSIATDFLPDGTAIGEGIANAINRMKKSTAKSRVMILLTDGINNRGSIDPITAADIARGYGIRIYTVGVGTRGMAPYPVKTQFGIVRQPMPVEIDEPMLRQVAQMTGGQYFRATDNRKLKEIWSRIDAMEKEKVEVLEFRRYTELFSQYLLLGAALLLAELLLSAFVFRKIPV